MNHRLSKTNVDRVGLGLPQRFVAALLFISIGAIASAALGNTPSVATTDPRVLPSRTVKVDGALDVGEWDDAPALQLSGADDTSVTLHAACDGPLLLLALRYDALRPVQSISFDLAAGPRAAHIVLTPQDLSAPLLSIRRTDGGRAVDDDSPPRLSLGLAYPDGRFQLELAIDTAWALGVEEAPERIELTASATIVRDDPIVQPVTLGGGGGFTWGETGEEPSRPYNLDGVERLLAADDAARQGWRAAIEQLDRGNMAQALQTLTALASHSPRQTLPRRMAASLAEQLGRHGLALDHIESAIAQRGPLPALVGRQVELLFAVGRFDDARHAVSRLPEAARQLPATRMTVIRCLFGAERFDDARAALDDLERSPDIPSADRIDLLRRIARMRNEIGHLQAALPEEERLRQHEANAPRVRLRTTEGDLVLVLYPEQAPAMVAAFLERIGEGYYRGLRFHGFTPGRHVATGDPAMRHEGQAGAGALPPIERERSGRLALRGALVMEAEGRQLSASRFRILLAPDAAASQGGAVFGRVVEGFGHVGRFSLETVIIETRVFLHDAKP